MISRKYSSLFFSALLTGAILTPGTLAAQETEKNDGNVNPQEKYNLPANFDPDFRPKKTPGNVRVTIDFRQAQLDEVVKFFSGAMNKNFIISDSINTSKTITIISPKEVSLNEAYRAFLAALQMNGLTIVPMGSFLKIVESKNAIVEPQTPYESGERIPNEARMVTAIVPIENAALDEIQPVIAKFLTQEATVIPYGSSLIITENADPAVRRDLERWVSDLAPESRRWEHDDEGPDDMPAHAKCALTKTSESIPISSGRLVLGTWQGIFLWELSRKVKLIKM